MPKEIVSTLEVCTGEPRMDGTRLTCANVVFTLSLGEMPLDDFLRIYPYLDVSDVRRCLEYCASQQCISEVVINFCNGCSLDKRKPESCLNSEYADGTAEGGFSSCDQTAEEPVNGWELARDLLCRLSWF